VPSEATPQPESISPTEPEPAEEPKPDEAAQPAEPPATVPAPALDKPSVAPDNGLERARAALETGDVDRAADEYGQLIKARRSLTYVVEDLEAALDQDPESSKLWQLLGDAYMKADRTSEAVKAYNRGMKEAEVLNSARQALASGDQQRAAAQYGILIKRKKRLDDVIRDLENAVAQADDQPAIWQVLGDAYMKADRLDESIEAYRKGMSSV
jgi:cytochrome c-type biogenesis protein CcmH/NrfG